MKMKYSLILAAILAVVQGMAVAQGRPTGAAAEHQHHDHDHNAMPAAPAAAKPAAGPDSQGSWKGRDWTSYPLITPVMRRGERDRMSAGLLAKNIEAGGFEIFAPDSQREGARRQVAMEPEGTIIKALPKLGNYYWVTARQEPEGQVITASTPYYFGEPGQAPTGMLQQQKHELEIVPQPLPREHGAWRESEKWQFLLRFNGQPLANKSVKMETEFGTRTAFVSDEKGVVTVLFPRDFKPAEKKPESGGHSHGPRRAKFVLAAEHDDGGKHYLTAFNYTYSADAERDRNLLAGVGFGLFGMLLAAPLLRRGKTATTAKEA